MQTINRLQRTLSAVAILTFSGLTAQAQVIVPPTNPDDYVGNYTTPDPYVNADMLLTNGGKLSVVAWQNGNGDTEVKVWDQAGGLSLFTIAGAHMADVALANVPGSPNDFMSVFVYKISNKTFLETYKINGVGSGSITTAPDSITLLSNSGGFPFIDMFADPTMLINGLPSMHQFVFTWGDYDPVTGNYILNASVADITAPLTYTTVPLYTGPSGNIFADVAASSDYNTGDRMAYCSRQDIGAGTLVLDSINYASPTPTTATVPLSSINPYIARIEALGLYDAAQPAQRWNVAAPIWNSSTSEYAVNIFNNAHITGYDCTPAGSAVDGNNWCNAIAAGPGTPYGGYSNENFTIGWHAYTNNIFVSQAVDVLSGDISTSYPDYYKVNTSPLGTMLPGKMSIALTSTSNAGKDLLTVWYDGHNNKIFYKETGDVNGYKPTAIAATGGTPSFKLYPNPAHHTVSVEMPAGRTFEYIRITDITGRPVYAYRTSASGAILNLESLAPGMYHVEITSDKGKEISKLILR